MLGKVADWKIPLGPYTPAQIAVAVGGGFLLVKTIPWWSWMGPVPVVAWVLTVWAVRRPKIKGRAPMQAALGWMLLAWKPRGGRIGGRAARDRAPHPLLGGFTIEDTPRPRGGPRLHGRRRAPRGCHTGHRHGHGHSQAPTQRRPGRSRHGRYRVYSNSSHSPNTLGARDEGTDSGQLRGGTEIRCQTVRETLARRQSLSGSPRGHNKGLTTQAAF
ncbi:hypothetical protein [Streptomyces umbrinus]|uniref:hypothetical protein n=1 Tax=Streptomyces umbrinus TaxID=67370 RepID=UPI00341C5496